MKVRRGIVTSRTSICGGGPTLEEVVWWWGNYYKIFSEMGGILSASARRSVNIVDPFRPENNDRGK